jgi:hypothetical protein
MREAEEEIEWLLLHSGLMAVLNRPLKVTTEHSLACHPVLAIGDIFSGAVFSITFKRRHLCDVHGIFPLSTWNSM